MSVIADKTILFILNLFAMEKLLTGSFSVSVVYILIIYSAFQSWLIIDQSGKYLKDMSNKRVKTAAIFQCLFAMIPLFVKGTHVILPIGIYDMAMINNRPALLISVVSTAVSALTGDAPLRCTLLSIAISLLALLIAYKTMKGRDLSDKLHRLRDDDALLNEKLKEGRVELMNAMDHEIASAQLSERNRIAREIHDNVGHMLSRALLQTGAMLAVHKNEPVSEELQGLRETLDTAMNSIRESVHDLRDESIDLDVVINTIAEPLINEGRTVNIELDHEEMTDGKIKYAVIGIVKEAVSNIIKHSNSDTVDIKLIEHPSMYQLIVYDYDNEHHSVDKTGSDGTDSKAHAVDMRGMGISNMESRAQGVGGTLTVSSDNGFKIFARIPKYKEA